MSIHDTVGDTGVGDAVCNVFRRRRWGAKAREGGGGGGGVCHHGPNPRVVVCAAGCEVSYVGGEEHAGDVGCVRGKGADRDEGGDVSVLNQFPDVYVSLWSSSD